MIYYFRSFKVTAIIKRHGFRFFGFFSKLNIIVSLSLFINSLYAEICKSKNSKRKLFHHSIKIDYTVIEYICLHSTQEDNIDSDFDNILLSLSLTTFLVNIISYSNYLVSPPRILSISIMQYLHIQGLLKYPIETQNAILAVSRFFNNVTILALQSNLLV